MLGLNTGLHTQRPKSRLYLKVNHTLWLRLTSTGGGGGSIDTLL